jgi:Tfp pilus assembly protein PilV
MENVRRRKKTAGFTIFEVTMAAGVMVLAIMSSLVAMGRAFAPLDSARCISYASQIMQSEMEKIRLTNWTAVSAYPTASTVVPFDTSGFVTAGDLGSRMQMTRTVRTVHTGMLEITLTITWTSYDRRTLSRRYVTYYGQNGLYDYFAI